MFLGPTNYHTGGYVYLRPSTASPTEHVLCYTKTAVMYNKQSASKTESAYYVVYSSNSLKIRASLPFPSLCAPSSRTRPAPTREYDQQAFCATGFDFDNINATITHQEFGRRASGRCGHHRRPRPLRRRKTRLAPGRWTAEIPASSAHSRAYSSSAHAFVRPKQPATRVS